MEAIRTIYRPTETLTIKIPPQWQNCKLEVLILPLEEDTIETVSSRELTSFQQLLLESPEMTEEEYEQIQQKRMHLNQWQ